MSKSVSVKLFTVRSDTGETSPVTRVAALDPGSMGKEVGEVGSLAGLTFKARETELPLSDLRDLRQGSI